MISCEINLVLGLINLVLGVISSATGGTKFKITDTKLYVPVVTLSAQDNAKLLQQLKSCFKRTVNWNKYQPRVSPERQNQSLNWSKFSRSKWIFCFIVWKWET